MNTAAHSTSAQAPASALASTAAWERALPWLLMGLGLVARLISLEANGLRTDEMYSVWMASRALPDMLRAIVLEGHDATPPTYYVVLHGVLQVSWSLWAIRLVSVLAGAAVVGLTYALARRLFDVRVAAISALLVALTPFSIEISQVARAYALAAALALASLYAFVRLRPVKVSPQRVWLYGLVTLLALATHYLVGVVVVVQNLIVLGLYVLRQLSRRRLLDWFRLQLVMGLVALPLVWMAVQRVPQAEGASTGQGWLEAPTPAGMVKALILWGTGDPSYGPTGFTVARGASLLVMAVLLGLGAFSAWRLWHTRPDQRVDVRRIGFVAAVFLGVWGLALGLSLVRKVFHEKYFIYLAPLLMLLLVWSALRIRPVLLGRGLLAALAGLVGLSLYVFYTAPNGEQWREAMAYVAAERQPGDVVITAPGYYSRPVGYYLEGEMPGVDYQLLRAPFALVTPTGFVAADYPADERELPDVDVAAAPAERVWLVTGYGALAPGQLDWFREDYLMVSERRFLGVTVILADEADEAGTHGAPSSALRPLNAPRQVASEAP